MCKKINTDKMLVFPNIVNINVLTGKCMCFCGHCPLGRTSFELRPHRFPYSEVDIALFYKVVNEIYFNNPASVLRIHSVGEPLYWPKLIDAVRYSKEKQVKTWMFTCAVTNDLDLLSDICENVDIIEVSVNSTDEKDYCYTKGINSFKLVEENLYYMRKYVDTHQLTTRLIASRVQSENKIRDDEFIDYWKRNGVVDDAFVRSYHTYNDIIPDISSNSLIKKEPCLVHWARLNVDTNGDVFICFNELFKEKRNVEFILGNLNNETIESIWNGEKLTSIREAELSGDYTKINFCHKLPCQDCKTYQPINGKRDTSEKQVLEIN